MRQGRQIDGDTQPLEVHFMPWATGLQFGRGYQTDRGECVDIGPVAIRPFRELRDDPKVSKDVAVHLTALFSRYLDVDGTPVPDMLICTHNEIDFRQLNTEEWADVRFAADALIFSSNFHNAIRRIASDDPNAYRLPSELFFLVGQRFVPGDETLTVNTWNTFNTWSTFREVSFQKPLYVSSPLYWLPTELINALSGLAKVEFSEQRGRIARSLEYFRMANSGSAAILLPARIVMITTALEALLSIKRSDSWKIAKALNRIVPQHDMIVEQRTRGGKKEQFHSIGLWTLDALYRIRNAVAHGDRVVVDRHWFDSSRNILQLDVANLVFGEILIRELNKLMLFGSRFTDQANKLKTIVQATDIEREIERALDHEFGLSKYHKALGWVEERRCGR